MERYTVRIKPYTGESLYSYILRFTNENGINLLTYLNSLKRSNNRYAQFSDIRALNRNPKSIIDTTIMEQTTGLNTKDILGMSMYYIINKFYDDNNVNHARFISGMIRDEFYYCPICLNEIKYHKLLWSLNEIEICSSHNVKLTNKCPHCSRVIIMKDVLNVGTCPYCFNTLDSNIIDDNLDQLYLLRQLWLYEAFNSMLTEYELKINCIDLAMRILYTLNKFNTTFNRKNIYNNSKYKNKLPTLLQHARETLTDKRTLSLPFILSTIYDNNISFMQFMKMQIPVEFINSIINNKIARQKEVHCLAPWCKNFEKKGFLAKTGTSFHKESNGNVLKYYLICPECGCEYAFDEYDNLIERTYFIKNYYILIKLSKKDYGLKRMALDAGQTEDVIRRSLAYFNSRGLFLGECKRKEYEVDKTILIKFVSAVCSGIELNVIKKWPIWEGYNHFLFYRFHNVVIQAFNKKEYEEYYGKKYDVENRKNFISDIVQQMFNKDNNITIKNVCKQANISPETIRFWKCNYIIAEMKKKQKERRLEHFEKNIINRFNNYINDNNSNFRARQDLYSYLGVSRKTLWMHGISINKIQMETIILDSNINNRK